VSTDWSLLEDLERQLEEAGQEAAVRAAAFESLGVGPEGQIPEPESTPYFDWDADQVAHEMSSWADPIRSLLMGSEAAPEPARAPGYELPLGIGDAVSGAVQGVEDRYGQTFEQMAGSARRLPKKSWTLNRAFSRSSNST